MEDDGHVYYDVELNDEASPQQPEEVKRSGPKKSDAATLVEKSMHPVAAAPQLVAMVEDARCFRTSSHVSLRAGLPDVPRYIFRALNRSECPSSDIVPRAPNADVSVSDAVEYRTRTPHQFVSATACPFVALYYGEEHAHTSGHVFVVVDTARLDGPPGSNLIDVSTGLYEGRFSRTAKNFARSHAICLVPNRIPAHAICAHFSSADFDIGQRAERSFDEFYKTLPAATRKKISKIWSEYPPRRGSIHTEDLRVGDRYRVFFKDDAFLRYYRDEFGRQRTCEEYRANVYMLWKIHRRMIFLKRCDGSRGQLMLHRGGMYGEIENQRLRRVQKFKKLEDGEGRAVAQFRESEITRLQEAMCSRAGPREIDQANIMQVPGYVTGPSRYKVECSVIDQHSSQFLEPIATPVSLDDLRARVPPFRGEKLRLKDALCDSLLGDEVLMERLFGNGAKDAGLMREMGQGLDASDSGGGGGGRGARGEQIAEFVRPLRRRLAEKTEPKMPQLSNGQWIQCYAEFDCPRCEANAKARRDRDGAPPSVDGCPNNTRDDAFKRNVWQTIKAWGIYWDKEGRGAREDCECEAERKNMLGCKHSFFEPVDSVDLHGEVIGWEAGEFPPKSECRKCATVCRAKFCEAFYDHLPSGEHLAERCPECRRLGKWCGINSRSEGHGRGGPTRFSYTKDFDRILKLVAPSQKEQLRWRPCGRGVEAEFDAFGPDGRRRRVILHMVPSVFCIPA